MKSEDFSITFLGTSAASINLYSPTSSSLVERGDTKILIDAGIGSLKQLRRAHIDSEEIDVVLITHWHFDHFAGLRALLKSRKTTSPISIYGPKPSVLARMYLIGLLHSGAIHFEAITENFSKNCGHVHIEPILTAHNIISCGWALTERVSGERHRKRRMVISGDTRPTQTIAYAAEGADLLVHEATYLDKDSDTAYAHDHSTVKEAANVAVRAGTGALALTHIARRYSRLSARNEAEKIFPRVLVPSPLDKIYIDLLPIGSSKECFGWGHVRM